ncbi:hypothetical protein Dda_5149 [Drechslerella dactyloides]|uniref:Uncharacterized protein n=1 Tax=Drechslerella dactyloides TaxID=74499 RepID=A0AAD6J001_DREDA|nr:hypothetical protein Dda_5149 [Drechslerella dactyloides]
MPVAASTPLSQRQQTEDASIASRLEPSSSLSPLVLQLVMRGARQGCGLAIARDAVVGDDSGDDSRGSGTRPMTFPINRIAD